MTVFGERPAPARIRELRRAILMFGLLFVLWWIVEFLNFAGRIGMDPLDVTGGCNSRCGRMARSASMAGAMSPLRQQIFHQLRPAARVSSFFRVPRTADRAFMKWISCRADPIQQRSHFRAVAARDNRFVLAANEVE